MFYSRVFPGTDGSNNAVLLNIMRINNLLSATTGLCFTLYGLITYRYSESDAHTSQRTLLITPELDLKMELVLLAAGLDDDTLCMSGQY